MWQTGLTSVTFRQLSTDQIIALAVDAELTGIEWGGDIHVPVGDLHTATTVCDDCAKAGLSVLSYGSYYRCDGDATAALQTAVALGAPTIRIWAGSVAPDTCTDAQFLAVVQATKQLADLAKPHGITIAFEYHRGTLTQTKESAYRLLNAVNCDNVGCYWQPNPDISLAEQLAEIQLLAPFIDTLHLFAWEAGDLRYPLAHAESAWMQYLQTIATCGKSQNLILEFVQGDRIDAFVDDCQTLKSWMLPTVQAKKLAIFYCNGTEIDHVFDEDCKEKLSTQFHLIPTVIRVDDRVAHQAIMRKTAVIFSTWGMPVMTDIEIADELPNLQAVFYGAGSVQAFARPFLQRGVAVFSAWAANAVPVAEYAVAQIVLAGKGAFQGMRRYRQGGRAVSRAFTSIQPGNYRIKVGILGAGMIGRLVLERLQGYVYDLMVYDPFASDELLEQYHATRATLDEIFDQCQIISNHIANLPATVGMLQYQHFSAMPAGATFINTGRGAQIVEADLIRALQEDPDRTALLDVFCDDEADRAHPFEALDNVFMTPHIAGSLANEVARMGQTMQVEATDWLDSQPTRYQVTLEMLETMA